MNVDGKANNPCIPCDLHRIVVSLNWMKAQGNYWERSALVRELMYLYQFLFYPCILWKMQMNLHTFTVNRYVRSILGPEVEFQLI